MRMGEPGANRRSSGRPGSGSTSPPRVSTTPALALSTIRAVSPMSLARSSSSATAVVTAAMTFRSASLGRDGSAEGGRGKPRCLPAAVNSPTAKPSRNPAGSTVYLREDTLVRQLDDWLVKVLDPDGV